MIASWSRYRLDFRFLARTSRDALTFKNTYFIRLTDENGNTGTGEAALFRGLSFDDRADYETKLNEVCQRADYYKENLDELSFWPSIRMGFETALLSLKNGGVAFPGEWSEGKKGIEINGLVWMGSKDEMAARMEQKIADGFKCIKIKIGGIDFERELELLRLVRDLSPQIELRLDANGAFSPGEALHKLDTLAQFKIHSIEQPVRQGQWQDMARICKESPIPIALDEELIGLYTLAMMEEMIETIKPQYIILKPSLVGGFAMSDKWIELAKRYGAGWWATSALESNVGLDAIGQWVSRKDSPLPQGLGTGQLYHNNIEGPVWLDGHTLRHTPGYEWKFPQLEWHTPC